MELLAGAQIVLALILANLLWICLKKWNLFKRMAPGPFGVPFAGSLFHLLKTDPIKEFQKYKEKFGKVFSLSVGDHYVTVVCDHKLILESLNKPEFNGRPDFELWAIRNEKDRNRGVLFSEGPVWQEQRRFVLRSLRDFGFGKESMEGILVQELQDLQNTLRKDLGKSISLKGVSNASILNSLWYITTGRRFELSDPNLKTLIHLLIDNFRATHIASSGLFFFTPVKYGLMGQAHFTAFHAFIAKAKELMDNVINEHLDTYVEGETRDFVDAYIEQIKAPAGSTHPSFHSEEGKKNLYIVLMDLFVAGAETTSTAFQWAILHLCHYPEAQKKCQEEIDGVIGRSRPPTRADKARLVYLEAFMSEVHRMATVVPYSIYHKALVDTEIGGHFVPQNSVVFFSVFDSHHDKDVWGDAETFRPERFLDESGTKFVKNEALIPFSSGKRQCLGEALARDTLFMFLAGLLQQFNFAIDPDCEANNKEDLRGVPSLVSSPKPFKVIINERKCNDNNNS